MRAKVFVSYSRKDAAWLAMCKAALGTGIHAEAFEVWSDEKIDVGTNWQEAIEAAIASSRIALLLVSKNYLRSDFIRRQELPAILNHHALKGLEIWWVPLDEISPTDDRLKKIKVFQSPWPLKNPLSKLPKDERVAAIGEIVRALIAKLGILADIQESLRLAHRQAVQTALGDEIEIQAALAAGDHSIIYRAKSGDEDVAVKALVPSDRREWLKDDFTRRANVVRKVKNSTAIGIKQVINKGGTQCVVMEFVNAPTLASRLKEKGPLPASLVARVLKHIARVAMQLNGMEGQPIIGPIRPSQVHYDERAKRVRLSLVHIANETLSTCRQRPTLLLDDAALTYLSPERYDGKNVDGFTDQYYLGLLGLELLQGSPPVDVKIFSNLELKRHFFDHPRAHFGDLPAKQPAFSFVLAKMLERNPQQRWASVENLIATLQEIEVGEVPKVVRTHASKDYKSKLHNNTFFFDSFYRQLFGASPDVGAIFRRRGVTTLDAQYRKLDGAIQDLFSFDPTVDLTTFDKHIESHEGFGLKPEHFEQFGDAFLGTLGQTPGIDDYSKDAWRSLLDAALTYMRDKMCLQPA